MDDILRIWLYNASNIFEKCDVIDGLSDAEKVKVIASKIFSLQSDFTLNDVCEKITQFLGFDIVFGTESLPVIVEACLICSVSPKNDLRATFVQKIMEMDKSSQSFLMQVIQDNLGKYKHNNLLDLNNEILVNQETESNFDAIAPLNCTLCIDKQKLIDILQSAQDNKSLHKDDDNELKNLR
jgi:hypothetical protein